jgi:hypothetical protein
VSRVRNAIDFQKKYFEALGNYLNVHRPRVDAARTNYKKNLKNDSSFADSLLEAQLRQLLIDPVLKALNWRLDVENDNESPNLIPEAQIQSSEVNTTKFLDYLGLNRKGKPLLIVETKRPSSLLPKRVKISGTDNVYLPSRESISTIICAGLKGKKLTGDWNEWLETLRVYVHEAFDTSKCIPRRVVLTNGNWLIIFKDPSDSFFVTGTCHPDNILVYENNNDIGQNYQEIFRWLEYQRVLNEAPSLTIEEIAFYISPGEITQISHGLKLKYFEYVSFFENSPRIIIRPILFLRTYFNSFLLIESQAECELPAEIEQLNNHLEAVKQEAVKLLDNTNKNLNANLTPISIEDYFEDEESFEIFRGVTVTEIRTHPQHDEYLIITGQHTHYLQLEPTVSNCSHHDWATSKQTGSIPLVQIQTRSVTNRSYFKTGEKQHCVHAGVERAKSCQITDENKKRCGSRSGSTFDPFCEIWRFETRLCCRTCVYENVCTKAEVFNLPCSKQ